MDLLGFGIDMKLNDILEHNSIPWIIMAIGIFLFFLCLTMIYAQPIEMKDILTHPEFESSKSIPIYIDSTIIGRVCLSYYLHGLYVIKQLMRDKCKTYLEIGTLFGGSMAMLMQSGYQTEFVGLDLFNYYGGKIDPDSKIEVTKWRATVNLIKHNKHNYLFGLTGGNSHNSSMVTYISFLYPKIDLMLIDADHSKAGVMQDFKDYSPLVPVGGIIIFDNYGDPAWPGVSLGIAELDLTNWNIVGQYGYMYIIERTN